MGHFLLYVMWFFCIHRMQIIRNWSIVMIDDASPITQSLAQRQDYS